VQILQAIAYCGAANQKNSHFYHGDGGMFRGYDLDAKTLDEKNLQTYETTGRSLFEGNKRLIQKELDNYTDANGDLLASKITEAWFPDFQADVFLSHSHKDEALVIQLAGWLKSNFGLVSFIDSCLWGYSDKLLAMMDKKYCYNSGKGTYDYDSRNRSTSHVHMMLSTALTKMIHECECIFFVSTPQSISTEKYIKATGMTGSPWIYSEILTTKLIQKRLPVEHRRRMVLDEAFEHRKEATAMVKYQLDVSHLIPITATDLDAWFNANVGQGSKALDTLYSLKQK
jgi:hypothetical protein